jgi:hypothetical protein
MKKTVTLAAKQQVADNVQITLVPSAVTFSGMTPEARDVLSKAPRLRRPKRRVPRA